MSEKYTYTVGGVTAKKETTKIQVNDVRIQQVNRTKQSIKGWRTAHVTAESLSNPNRTRLYDLYSDILLDGHLSGIIQKRRLAVLKKGLEYYDKSGKKVDAMDGLISSMPFRKLLNLIFESVLWGISGIEFIPNGDFAFVPIPRKHIKPEQGVISLEQNSATGGIPYEDNKFLWVVGEKSDLGLLLSCAPYVIYKRDTFGDWANYIELFGQPVRIIKYDANDEQTKIELKQILDESGSSLALMIPSQAEFEIMDGKQSNGNGELQERFIKSLIQELSVIIVGNTETTTNGTSGSQAKSKVHQEQQQDITSSDLSLLTAYLNDRKFLAILKNYDKDFDESGHFKFTTEVNIEKQAAKLEMDRQLAEIVPVDDEYFYETYGMPKPKNYDTLKAEKAKNRPKPKSKNQDPDEEEEENLRYHKTGKLRNLFNALKYFFP